MKTSIFSSHQIQNLGICFFILALTITTSHAATLLPYGVLDTGLLYSHEKYQNGFSNQLAQDYIPSYTIDDFRMEPSINMGSRFGIRASEMIGQTQISLILENGFSPDTGLQNHSDRFFDRGASLSVSGSWGQISMGRIGTFTSSMGIYNIFTSRVDVMDGGFYWLTRGVYDNMITIQSPTFANTTVAAQYSFEINADHQKEGSSDAQRYVALAITHDHGPLQVAMVGEAHLRASDQPSQCHNAYAIGLGGNWTSGNTTVYLGGQYGWNESIFGWISSNDFLSSEWLAQHQGTFGQFDGYNLHVGVNQSILGGEWQLGVFYNRANGDIYPYNNEGTFSEKIKKYGFISMYSYQFGKKAQIYTGLAYTQDEVYRDEAWRGNGVFKRSTLLATLGLSVGF